MELAEEYLLWVALGAVFQVLGTGLVPFLRNMGRAVAAMAAMMAGFLTNVVLDWLFVWVLPWGMAGAAAATVLGQAVTFLVCLAVMIRRGERPARGEMRLLGRVLAAALSPFGLTFSPNLTLIFVNRAAVETGGDSAVACYAAVSYLTCVALLLLQGVTDGSQPLLSLAHGRGEERQVLALRGMTLACALLVGAGCAAVLFLLRQSAAALFGASPAVTAQTAAALPVFLPGLLCAALSRTATSYCYAVQRDRWACLLIYGEPATLLLLLLVLPRLWGIWGVWWAVPLSQLCAATLGWRVPAAHPPRQRVKQAAKATCLRKLRSGRGSISCEIVAPSAIRSALSKANVLGKGGFQFFRACGRKLCETFSTS